MSTLSVFEMGLINARRPAVPCEGYVAYFVDASAVELDGKGSEAAASTKPHGPCRRARRKQAGGEGVGEVEDLTVLEILCYN